MSQPVSSPQGPLGLRLVGLSEAALKYARARREADHPVKGQMLVTLVRATQHLDELRDAAMDYADLVEPDPGVDIDGDA